MGVREKQKCETYCERPGPRVERVRVRTLLSVSTRTLPQGVEGSAGSYKINLRNILHMYTIGAVIMCFKPIFFVLYLSFPKISKTLAKL